MAVSYPKSQHHEKRAVKANAKKPPKTIKPIWESMTSKMLARNPEMFNNESPGTPKKSRLMIKMKVFSHTVNEQLSNFIDHFFITKCPH